jgi:hypothetical protein
MTAIPVATMRSSATLVKGFLNIPRENKIIAKRPPSNAGIGSMFIIARVSDKTAMIQRIKLIP